MPQEEYRMTLSVSTDLVAGQQQISRGKFIGQLTVPLLSIEMVHLYIGIAEFLIAVIACQMGLIARAANLSTNKLINRLAGVRRASGHVHNLTSHLRPKPNWTDDTCEYQIPSLLCSKAMYGFTSSLHTTVVTVVGCHVLMPNLLPIRVRGEEVSTTYS
jgi:hypothetical protein